MGGLSIFSPERQRAAAKGIGADSAFERVKIPQSSRDAVDLLNIASGVPGLEVAAAKLAGLGTIGAAGILKKLGVRPTKADIMREIVNRGRPSESKFLEMWGKEGVPPDQPELDLLSNRLSTDPNPRRIAFSKEPLALRYETDLPKYDEGISHYDIAGGGALPGIVRQYETFLQDADDPLAEALEAFKSARIRASLLENVTPSNTNLIREYDPFIGNYYIKNLVDRKGLVYPNAVEGSVNPEALRALPSKTTIRDVVNDPDLRRAYNLSIAVPEHHPLQKNSVIFRKTGGLACTKQLRARHA